MAEAETGVRMAIPQDLYGLFLIEPLQLNCEVDGCAVVALAMMRSAFFVAMLYTIQLFFISQIQQQNDVHADICGHGRPALQMVCVFVFSVSIFRELLHAYNLFELLWHCPIKAANRGSYTELIGTSNSNGSHGAVLQRNEKKGGMSSIMRWARKQTKKTVWSLDNMTICWKAISLAFVAVPRMVIGALLAWVGVGFIMKSDEDTLMFDTLSCVFVVDICALMYGAFTTDIVKHQVQEAKPVEWHPSNSQRLAMFLFSSFLHPAIVVGYTFGTVNYWRHECGLDTDQAFTDIPADVEHSLKSIMSLFYKH
eukprot:TRINITY_DN12803_c0_g1_i1.p1 TRINITY_DN12803_c0_g1~~TRINITY_DN12803_c0_g1_i1.p1  ORF type:complete len:310 (+),score=66.42 TRINITY_DN12803_c0_g1_i1:69-998(+)